MARLTSLSVKFQVRPSSTQLFDGFKFPMLTSLHMEPGWDFSWGHPEHFYDQLRTLRTFNFIGASEDLVKLLHRTPSLVNLHAMIHTSL